MSIKDIQPIYSVQWFNSLVSKINELEHNWINNTPIFNQSIFVEEYKVAQMLQISIKTLKRYCQKNYFKVYRIGKRNFLLQHDIIRGVLLHLVK